MLLARMGRKRNLEHSLMRELAVAVTDVCAVRTQIPAVVVYYLDARRFAARTHSGERQAEPTDQ